MATAMNIPAMMTMVMTRGGRAALWRGASSGRHHLARLALQTQTTPTTATTTTSRRLAVRASSSTPAATNGAESSTSDNGGEGFDYDLFVIGGGSGGVRAARFSATMGAKVGLCEMPYNPISSDTEGGLGGTCVLRGCVPKKLMMYASLFPHDMEVAKGFGWDVAGGSQINFKDFQRRKRKELQRLNGIYNKLLVNAGVEVIEGRGSLVDKHTVQVGDKTFSSKYILIATGGRAFVPNIPGRELVITSDEALELDELPESMIVVGGGYIGLEKACIFNALGVKVDVFIRGEKILNGFDDEVRTTLQDAIEASGITIHTKTSFESIQKREDDGKLVLTTNVGDFAVDHILFATGRKPNVGGLNLEGVGVETKKGGAIVVDTFSKTSVASIYAVGDVTDRMNLTPVALMEGGAVASTLFGGVDKQADHEYVASAVFTQPSLATVGYTEEQAKERFGDIDIYTANFKAMKQSLLEEEDGITPERIFMKLIVDAKSERVVGAHMIGPDSAEIMQGLAIAIKMGAKKSDFDRTIGIHPSAAEEFVTMRTAARQVRQKEEVTASTAA